MLIISSLTFCTLVAKFQCLGLLKISKIIILRACKKSEVLNVGAEAQVGLALGVTVLRKVSAIELNQELNQDQDLVYQEVDRDLQTT